MATSRSGGSCCSGRLRSRSTSLGLKVHVLFDTFGDQQNIVILSRQPGDERRSLYFQPGDLKEQVVRFQAGP